MAVNYFPPKLSDAQVLWIDAICGAGFGSESQAIDAHRLGLALPTGNIRADVWAWDRSVLAHKTEDQLAELYASIKAGQGRVPA